MLWAHRSPHDRCGVQLSPRKKKRSSRKAQQSPQHEEVARKQPRTRVERGGEEDPRLYSLLYIYFLTHGYRGRCVATFFFVGVVGLLLLGGGLTFVYVILRRRVYSIYITVTSITQCVMISLVSSSVNNACNGLFLLFFFPLGNIIFVFWFFPPHLLPSLYHNSPLELYLP